MDVGVRGPRLNAALRCYALADRRTPGSPGAEAAEHAVLYALSDRRALMPVDDLVRDALHDGARTVIRAMRGRGTVERELGYLSAAGIDTAGARAGAGGDLPEHTVLARELLGVLRRRAADLGGPAPRVLAGMLVGETEIETALATGTSRSTITRTRRAFRACATSAGYRATAA
jgi:hypothetical protein